MTRMCVHMTSALFAAICSQCQPAQPQLAHVITAVTECGKMPPQQQQALLIDLDSHGHAVRQYDAHGVPSASSQQGATARAASFLRRAFLPEAYPQSVTPDYAPFQLFDTVQVGSLHEHVVNRCTWHGATACDL
jgi:hypothetical protein